MNYLTLENITKSYGPKILFQNVSLHINKGERIALVAKNGTGKTTLLRVLAGTEGSEGENAKIIFAKDIRIGYLTQDPQFDENLTALEVVFMTENPEIQAIKNYEKAIYENDGEGMEKYLNEIETLQAWDAEAKVKEIISQLKIDDYLTQKVKTLSGGQKKRLALANLLVDEPDFLILDEPTNHLDLEMIEWLESYFSTRPNLTIFMVTHDRYFLDAVCNTIIELDGGKFYRYKGNYGYYLSQKALRQEVEAATMDKSKKLFLKELDWMRRQPQARTTKAQSRIDDFYELKEKVSQKTDKTSLEMDIKTTWLGSKVLELHNVSKGFGERKLIENFSYKFRRGERVGIVGNNGAGKSTFLRLITEEMAPDSGKVVVGDTISYGYYTQDGLVLGEDRRVLQVITDIAEYIPLAKGQKMTAAALLEKFLFSREQQQVYVSQLSGGEKRRLYLLTILMKNPNFLILDEPTNDIDIVTLNVLEEFLTELYNGCLVVVTHDRYFMDNIVEHLFIFEGEGKIRDFNGNYTEYQMLKKTADREAKKNTTDNTPKIVEKVPDTEGGASRKLTDTERKEFKRLERDIEKLEEQKAKILEKFNDTSIAPAEIEKLSKELQQIESSLGEKELRWLELSEWA